MRGLKLYAGRSEQSAQKNMSYLYHSIAAHKGNSPGGKKKKKDLVLGRFCKENSSAKTPVFCCRCDNAPHVGVLITKILLSGIGTQVNLSQITVGLKWEWH